MPPGSSSAAPVMRPGPRRAARPGASPRGRPACSSSSPLQPEASASSTTSTQCRTGTRLPLCRCGMQPTLAETMVSGSSASQMGELAVAQRHRPAPAAAPSRFRPSRSTGALFAARQHSKPSAAAAVSTPPRTLLAVLQGAGRVEGEPRPLRLRRELLRQRRRDVGQELGQIPRQLGDAARLLRVRRIVAQRVAVFLDRHAAARGVHDDRLDAAARRPAATRRRCCAASASSAPSWSLRCRRIAPQQPASRRRSVWMPAASSTRAVARLMFGVIAGCTQPSSSSTLRACSRRRPVRARALRGRHLGLQRAWAAAAAPAGRASSPGRTAGEVRPSFSAMRSSALAGRPRAPARRRSAGRSRPACRTARRTGQVVSQLRQVRQRSRCSCVARSARPSSTCLIR